MQNNSIKNFDDLTLGIRNILSKNCCSFSDEEQVLLEDCIKKLEEMSESHDIYTNTSLVIKVVSELMKVFFIAEHFKNLF